MRTPSCPKCQGAMVEGFILAERQGTRAVSKWVEGAPQRGFFGLKFKTKPVEVRSWRCQRCGLLESYVQP